MDQLEEKTNIFFCHSYLFGQIPCMGHLSRPITLKQVGPIHQKKKALFLLSFKVTRNVFGDQKTEVVAFLFLFQMAQKWFTIRQRRLRMVLF